MTPFHKTIHAMRKIQEAAGQLSIPPEILDVDVDVSKLTLAERYAAFARANPNVEHAIVSVARELRDKHGIRRIGIAMIFERLRWLHAIATEGDAYRLNNSFRAFYARDVMSKHSDLAGFFAVRRQAS